MDFPSQTMSSPSESASAGEAEVSCRRTAKVNKFEERPVQWTERAINQDAPALTSDDINRL
jgi:hypothetical protein